MNIYNKPILTTSPNNTSYRNQQRVLNSYKQQPTILRTTAPFNNDLTQFTANNNIQKELINNYDVFTFTLPGHDGNFKKKITYKDWIKKVDSEMEFLISHGYEKIYVIGHSMGGVLASYITAKYPQVKKLVLVAPAFRISGFEEEKFNMSTALTSTPKIFEEYGVQLVTNRLLKLPPNCYVDFFKLVKELQENVKNVKVPTLIFRGTKDFIVPQESVDYVYESVQNRYKKIVMLEKTTHDVFRENKKGQATDLIIKFFKNYKSIENFPNGITAPDLEDK